MFAEQGPKNSITRLANPAHSTQNCVHVKGYIQLNKCSSLPILEHIPDGHHIRVIRPQRLFLDRQRPLQQWAPRIHMTLRQHSLYTVTSGMIQLQPPPKEASPQQALKKC